MFITFPLTSAAQRRAIFVPLLILLSLLAVGAAYGTRQIASDSSFHAAADAGAHYGMRNDAEDTETVQTGWAAALDSNLDGLRDQPQTN